MEDQAPPFPLNRLDALALAGDFAGSCCSMRAGWQRARRAFTDGRRAGHGRRLSGNIAITAPKMARLVD